MIFVDRFPAEAVNVESHGSSEVLNSQCHYTDSLINGFPFSYERRSERRVGKGRKKLSPCHHRDLRIIRNAVSVLNKSDRHRKASFLEGDPRTAMCISHDQEKRSAGCP